MSDEAAVRILRDAIPELIARPAAAARVRFDPSVYSAHARVGQEPKAILDQVPCEGGVHDCTPAALLLAR